MEENQQNMPGSQPLPPLLEPVDHHHKWWITAIVIVVVAIIAGAVALYFPSDGLETGIETTEETAHGQLLTSTEEGKIVSNFPLELILDDVAVTEQSYSIEYQNEGIVQVVASFYSNRGFEEIVQDYIDYLDNNGWFITDENEKMTSDGVISDFIYARTTGKQVSVTITDNDPDPLVLIGYFEIEESEAGEEPAELEGGEEVLE